MTSYRKRLRRRALESPWLMPAVDTLLAFTAFGLAYVVRYELQLRFSVAGEFFAAPFEPYLPLAVIYVVWLHLTYRGSGLYRTIRGRSWLDETYAILNGVTNATVVLLAISFIFQPQVYSRLMMIYVAAITVVLLSGARIILRIIQSRLRSRGIGIQRTLVIGAGDIGRSVLRTMIARKELGYHPIGYLDEDSVVGSVDLGRVKGLGGVENLEMVIRQVPVDHVVITLSWSNHDRILKLIQICQKYRVEVSVVPDVFQLNVQQVQIENVDGIPLLRVNGHVPLKGSNRLVKRAMDIVLIVLLSPILALIFGFVMLAIRLEGRGPIFYTARRVGESGREFRMIKFRSMIPNADLLREELVKTHELDPRHPKLKDDPRVTKVGRFIRRTSIDELPNLLNVLAGHMSLVGPRPPTPEEVTLYEAWHMQRLQVKPGMTGLWQVSGRSEVPFDEMCLLDIYYIENWSMQLDAQILMMTIPRVLLRQGAY
jgi:exopolysaccharide biosynthesis polyprenyl glycosylphosphotransferase